MIFEKGRVCLKFAGREAGKYCVVVEPLDNDFVMITGPKSVTRIKRRKCNVAHLEPTTEILSIGSGSDVDVESAWSKSGLIEKFNILLPKKKVNKE